MSVGTSMKPKEMRELMALRGWTQRKLAAELEVHEASVSRWLAGDIPVVGPPRILMQQWLDESRNHRNEPVAV